MSTAREFTGCKGSHGADWSPCKIWFHQQGTERNGWRPQYGIKLHYNHKAAIKRAFPTAFWHPTERIWTIQWEGPDDNLAWRYAAINHEIEQEAAYNSATSKPPPPPSSREDMPYASKTPPRTSSQPQYPSVGHQPPSASYYSMPSERARVPTSYVPRRPEGREPSPPPKIRVTVGQDGNPQRTVAEPVHEEGEAEEEMETEVESRPVPNDCRMYADEQVTYYDRDHRSSIFEALIVRERTFPTHVTCVTIYGKVQEVEAYFAGRFLGSRNGPSYVTLAHTENKYHDRGLRVVAAFI